MERIFLKSLKLSQNFYGSDFDPDRLETHCKYNLKTDLQYVFDYEIVRTFELFIVLPCSHTQRDLSGFCCQGIRH